MEMESLDRGAHPFPRPLGDRLAVGRHGLANGPMERSISALSHGDTDNEERQILTHDHGQRPRLQLRPDAADRQIREPLVSTLGGGLYKLNTTTGEVATFKTANSALPSDYVESSLMTKDGKLYFGTSNGLSVFNPVSGQLQTYLNEESNSNPGAQKINPDL